MTQLNDLFIIIFFKICLSYIKINDMRQSNLLFHFLIFTTLFAINFAQKEPHWLDDRNTIVHLFEWKFTDIADECERFLSKKGYGGVQVSKIISFHNKLIRYFMRVCFILVLVVANQRKCNYSR